MDNLEKEFSYTWYSDPQGTCRTSSPGEVYELLEDLYGAEGMPTVWWLADAANENYVVYASQDNAIRVIGRVSRATGIRHADGGASEVELHGLVPGSQDASEEAPRGGTPPTEARHLECS